MSRDGDSCRPRSEEMPLQISLSAPLRHAASCTHQCPYPATSLPLQGHGGSWPQSMGSRFRVRPARTWHSGTHRASAAMRMSLPTVSTLAACRGLGATLVRRGHRCYRERHFNTWSRNCSQGKCGWQKFVALTRCCCKPALTV